MTDDDLPGAGFPAVRFTATLGRAICARLASGESQVSICADARMPSRATLLRWVRDMPKFAAAVAKARAAGGRTARAGQASTYCPTTADEIFDRMCAGEAVTAICADPAMPSFSTVYYWRKHFPEFREAMRVAREVQAERFCDLGWTIAAAVTPGDAHATAVKLAQLRWTAAVLAPRRFGRMKPVEREDAAGKGDLTVIVQRFSDAVDPHIGRPLLPGEQYVLRSGPRGGGEDEDADDCG